MRSQQVVTWVVIVGIVASSCATPRGSSDALPDIEPGQRPTLESDEAGLWMQMDRMEEGLRTSGRVVTDPQLNSYIRSIVCKLAGKYCSDIRIYIVQTPHFNATMAPNGVMQVWTGLILRAQNEAQLAYVLGHELGHYLRRHSLQRWRSIRSSTNALVVFQVLTVAAGVGFVGDLTQLAYLASLYAYSRDQEREADEVGFELIEEAGYDPREAPHIWKALLDERAVGEGDEPLIFFSSHPSTEERIDTLTDLAEKSLVGGKTTIIGADPYLTATLPIRTTLLDDEVDRRQFAQTEVLLERLMTSGKGLGTVYFFQGELYRLRGENDDLQKAIASYEGALQFEDAPPETKRALGLVFYKSGEKEKARLAYERYLEQEPDAHDREMIQMYLNELR